MRCWKMPYITFVRLLFGSFLNICLVVLAMVVSCGGPSFAEEGKIVVTNEMIYQKLLEIEKRQYLRKDLLK